MPIVKWLRPKRGRQGRIGFMPGHLASLGKRYLEKSIHITGSGWRAAPWNSTQCHYQRVEKSAVGGLMTGQIEKILWRGV